MKLVEHHGLVPVPVDLDPDTLSPRLDLVRAAVTPVRAASPPPLCARCNSSHAIATLTTVVVAGMQRTKLFIVAHIFGTRSPMEELCSVAHEHGVLVVEDAAEAFVGLQYKGSDACDANMFSFGTIKTATAMGGCITRVKDPELRRDMHEIHNRCV